MQCTSNTIIPLPNNVSFKARLHYKFLNPFNAQQIDKLRYVSRLKEGDDIEVPMLQHLSI